MGFFFNSERGTSQNLFDDLDMRIVLKKTYDAVEELSRKIECMQTAPVAKRKNSHEKQVPDGYMSVKDFVKKYEFISDSCVNDIINKYSIDFITVKRNRCFNLSQFMNVILFNTGISATIRNKLNHFMKSVPALENIVYKKELQHGVRL